MPNPGGRQNVTGKVGSWPNCAVRRRGPILDGTRLPGDRLGSIQGCRPCSWKADRYARLRSPDVLPESPGVGFRAVDIARRVDHDAFWCIGQVRSQPGLGYECDDLSVLGVGVAQASACDVSASSSIVCVTYALAKPPRASGQAGGRPKTGPGREQQGIAAANRSAAFAQMRSTGVDQGRRSRVDFVVSQEE
jgi:hypothetical protein